MLTCIHHTNEGLTYERMQHYDALVENEAKDCGLCDPPMNDKLAITMLKNYLLGENWYVVIPENSEQCNTAIVHEILMKYSKEYRKEMKISKRH